MTKVISKFISFYFLNLFLFIYFFSEHIVDLRLNHSNALEVTEETTLSESNLRLSGLSGLSFDEDGIQQNNSTDQSTSKESGNLMSPTIAIPSSSKRNQLNTIDCEIGSKISTEDAEMLEATMAQKANRDKSVTIASITSSTTRPSNWSDQQTQYQISDMSAESLIWLTHRLGPVLTARHLTRNLLKMLTLCYVGQDTLLPDMNDESVKDLHDNLLVFTIADSRVAGDRSAVKVLECLTSIAGIYGDHFILLQYFPHITELIALCKKRITANLEGGLISSLQLLKYLVPCLNDTTIMDQLHVRQITFERLEFFISFSYLSVFRMIGHNFEEHYTSDHTTNCVDTFSYAQWVPGTRCVGQEIARYNLCACRSNWPRDDEKSLMRTGIAKVCIPSDNTIFFLNSN